MFDILITVAQKDFNKLRFVVNSIQKRIDAYHNIYCISDMPMPDKLNGVQYYIDDDVIDFDFSKIDMVNRRGWYKQQFIKLFQEITVDNYFVIDADVIINKPLEINTAHPFFFFGKDQSHQPYFTFLKDVLDLERAYPHSFICEMMFFKRVFIKYMLSELGVDRREFFDICAKEINKINDGSGFSEYEMYGNYMTKHFSGLYQYKNIKVMHQAKKRLWNDDEIKAYISEYKDYDLLTMHTWI